MRIVFMGTPTFAIPSLQILLDNNYEVAGVVTIPDKPCGRGKKMQESPVKIFAKENNLKILQPDKLKTPEFLEDLKKLNADLFMVVAFRMLPEIVWNMPKYGTINLHASLLPQYRGAAPINWAIINGEKETGVTTFFIDLNIDTGNIIFQEKVFINDKETAGDLHDKLKITGAELVLKTVKTINNKNCPKVIQDDLIKNKLQLKIAPKINKDDCEVDWNKSTHEIYNFIRGLSPFPTAWTQITSDYEKLYLKIYKVKIIEKKHNYQIGKIITDNKKYFRVAVSDGLIDIIELQLQGKKRLNIKEFLLGFQKLKDFSVLPK